MGMFDSLLQQLESSPVVQKTVEDFKNLQRVLVATVNRFDERFGALDAKADKIIFLLEHTDKTIVPAGDDGLMKLLGESGEEMIVRDDFAPIPVVNHESEGHFVGDGSQAEQRFKERFGDAVRVIS